MTSIKFDTREVKALALDLSKAPGRVQRSAPKVFEVGALKTKRHLQRMARGHRFLGGLDSAVAYDRMDGVGLAYEIGFDKGGVGSLANIAVYGSMNNSPVMGSPFDALRLELPSILRHLADAGESAAFGGTQ